MISEVLLKWISRVCAKQLVLGTDTATLYSATVLGGAYLSKGNPEQIDALG